MNTRTEQVEGLIARFPHIPREAVLKEDLLRTGIAFDDSALSDNLEGEVKPKSYFIFSFDQKPLKELGTAAIRRPPEEVALTGGPWELRRTIVSVRTNPDSPYRITRGEAGTLQMWLDGRVIALDCVNATRDYVQGRRLVETGAVVDPARISDPSVALKELSG